MSLKNKIKQWLLACLPARTANALNFLGPVHWTSVVNKPHKIIGKGDYLPLGLQPGCYIQAMNGIHVGTNFLYGPNVHIISANHDTHDYDVHVPCSPIIIGDNCWIGAGCIILPGVELGDHVIVAAGSVVTKSFGSNQVIGGTPAKHIAPLGEYIGKCNRGYFKYQ